MLPLGLHLDLLVRCNRQERHQVLPQVVAADRVLRHDVRDHRQLSGLPCISPGDNAARRRVLVLV